MNTKSCGSFSASSARSSHNVRRNCRGVGYITVTIVLTIQIATVTVYQQRLNSQNLFFIIHQQKEFLHFASKTALVLHS